MANDAIWRGSQGEPESNGQEAIKVSRSVMNPKFILIGGFLGAGKSTTVARLAKHYQSQGKRVGIITNDQTTDLVDTHSLENQGFDVGEVAGACFCCSFNELTGTVEQLSSKELPDVIIAEPVGSCTDLVATVIKPLTSVYNRPLDIAPYGVILKPSHGQRILSDGGSGFSPKAAYIFRKQIEESDFVVVNRIDELSDEQVGELKSMVQREYPGRTLVLMSAKTGAGFDDYVEQLDSAAQPRTRVLEVDYDVYAEGEAELGWLNSQVHLQAAREFSLDEQLLWIVGDLHAKMVESAAEVAHLKAIGMWDGNYAVANAVSNFTQPELSLQSGVQTARADIVVNARVAAPPELLQKHVEATLEGLALRVGGELEVRTMQAFRPGRPVPTHRIE